MDERILKWLFDVKMSIDEINSFFKDDAQKDFFKYKENLMLKRAVERNLEIIGEAVKRDNTYIERISYARAIIGLRNHVIRAYDSISDENIWSILTYHLPKLKREINLLISDEKE